METSFYTDLMKLMIGFTCVGVFIITAVATMLDLLNILNIKSDIRKKLHTFLLIEVVAIGTGVAAGLITLTPKNIVEKFEVQENTIESLEKRLNEPVVYIHIGDELQRVDMEKLSDHLNKSNYQTPGIENVGAQKVPKQTEIRYFHDVDKEEAQRLKNELIKSGIKDIYLRKLNMKSRQGNLEIWLSSP